MSFKTFFLKSALSTKIVVGIAFILFLIRCFLIPKIYPEILEANDYYGYIELGRQIFHELDFIVLWHLDNPVRYPPLFSILIYCMTFFTKDPFVSIQYLNAFSTSFLLVPFFCVSRKLINPWAAIAAIIFIMYFLGLTLPCFYLFSDFFFIFLFLTAFWMLWEVCASKSQKIHHFFLMGVLIFFVYLTKYSGGILLFLALIWVTYFSIKNVWGIKKSFRSLACLLFGFLPLFLLYNMLADISRYSQQSCDIGLYTFLDGNYIRPGQREKELYKLNADGTEFNHLVACQKTSVVSFLLQHPKIIGEKYFHGLKEVFKVLTRSVFPFAFAGGKSFYIIIQGVLIALIFLCFQCHLRISQTIYILFFFLAVLLVPIYAFQNRYVTTFVPFYFLLWLEGISSLYFFLYNFFGKKRFLKRILQISLVVFIGFFILNYTKIFFQKAFLVVDKHEGIHNQYFKIATWLKEDFKNQGRRPKIMSRKTTLAYMSGAYYIALPYEMDWRRIVDFARLKNVDYIILEGGVVTAYRPEQWEVLMHSLPDSPDIRLVYVDKAIKNHIRIFRIFYDGLSWNF